MYAQTALLLLCLLNTLPLHSMGGKRAGDHLNVPQSPKRSRSHSPLHPMTFEWRSQNNPSPSPEQLRYLFPAQPQSARANSFHALKDYFPEELARIVMSYLLGKSELIQGFSSPKGLALSPLGELCIWQSQEDKDGKAILNVITHHHNNVLEATFLNCPPFPDQFIYKRKGYSFMLTHQKALFKADHAKSPLSFSRAFTQHPEIQLFSVPIYGLFIAIAHDKYIHCYDIETEKKRCSFEHAAKVSALCFHPSRSELLSGGENGTIKRWNLKAQQCTQTFSYDARSILHLAFHPKGFAFASASADHTVRIWSTRGNDTPNHILSHQFPVQEIAFSADNCLAVATAVNSTGSIYLWENLAPGQRPYSVQLSFPDQRELAEAAGIDEKGTPRPFVNQPNNLCFLLNGHLCYQLDAQAGPRYDRSLVMQYFYDLSPLPDLQKPAPSAQRKLFE